MEGMNIAKLEAVVEKMLGHLQELRRENAGLQAQLEARNNKIAELEAKLNAMTSTQEEVSSRVTNLLSSIEDWEKSTATGDSAEHEGNEVHEEVMPSRGGNLFSLGE